MRVLDRVPQVNKGWSSGTPDPATSAAPYRIYNIGNDTPVRVLDVLEELESALCRAAHKSYLLRQPGDMQATRADVDDLQRDGRRHLKSAEF